MLLLKKVSLFLMWVFIIGMYVFKGEYLEEAQADLSAETTMPALATVQADNVEDEVREVEARYMVYNLHNKLKAHKHDHDDCEHETTIKLWTGDEGEHKVVWTSNGDHKEWSDAHGLFKINKDNNVWVSGNSDVKILSGDASSDVKVYSINKLKSKLKKVKEIKAKHKELKLEEGNKVISIYSTSPHNIKIKTLDKKGN